MRKLKFISILAAVSFVVLPACQQLEEDVFEKPSSTRLSEFLEDIRTTLAAEQYGWTLDYFPGSKYAGVTYALKFTGQQVTATLETNPTVSETSSYALTTDDGPVLSFDTYNTVLHAYATPDQRNYQAKGGDFEFEISSFDKAKKEIVLIGKRSRNHCTLRPLGKSAEEYFAGVKEFESSLAVPAAAGTVDGKEYELYLDSGNRSISITEKGAEDEEAQTVRYVLTENTLRFSEPFTIGNVEFDEWTYDTQAETLNGSGVSFLKFIPPGYVTYEEYLGDYTFYYYNKAGSFRVTRTPQLGQADHRRFRKPGVHPGPLGYRCGLPDLVRRCRYRRIRRRQLRKGLRHHLRRQRRLGGLQVLRLADLVDERLLQRRRRVQLDDGNRQLPVPRSI